MKKVMIKGRPLTQSQKKQINHLVFKKATYIPNLKIIRLVDEDSFVSYFRENGEHTPWFPIVSDKLVLRGRYIKITNKDEESIYINKNLKETKWIPYAVAEKLVRGKLEVTCIVEQRIKINL